MLIDSGATTTAISASTAAAAGITIDERGFPEVISTANGAIAALPGVAAQVTIGGITARDLPVIVSPAFGDTNVIGMNFLSQLKAWRVEGRDIVLIPDRQSVVSGKSVSVRVDIGGRRYTKKKKKNKQ